MLPFPLQKEIRIFAAYAKKDKKSVERFKLVLSLVSKLPKVSCYDIDVSPGKEWEQEELEHLLAADIILLLVSLQFLTSNYYIDQLEQAIERHKQKQARVIPIILRTCPWEDSNCPLHVLVPLPEDGKPINKWASPDDALTNIYYGIKKVIEELQNAPSSNTRQA